MATKKAKPDYIDLDKDGDKKEPMKKAAKDAKKKTNEGLGELADMAERDHEVQMARAELYKVAKYAIKLHDMLKGVTEAEGIEGWQQAKITKASDYISSVYHSLDYDQKFNNTGEMPAANVMPTEGKKYKSDAQRKAIHAAKAKKESTDPYKSILHQQLSEKAKSKAQQRFMGMVHSAQKGEKPASKEVAKVAKSMPKKAANDYASTKHKGKPEHKK